MIHHEEKTSLILLESEKILILGVKKSNWTNFSHYSKNKMD